MSNNASTGLLKWMLEDVRIETLKGVDHLSAEQLFKPPADGEYPIGAYLMHLAECDIFWLEVLSGIEQPADLKKDAYYDVWFDAYKTSSPPSSPLDKEVYLNVMLRTRKNFLDYISGMEDKNLEEKITRKRNEKEIQISKKWIIYHIIEHEAHHRGQMFMLIRKAGWNKK